MGTVYAPYHGESKEKEVDKTQNPRAGGFGNGTHMIPKLEEGYLECRRHHIGQRVGVDTCLLQSVDLSFVGDSCQTLIGS